MWIASLSILPIRFVFLYTLGRLYPSKYLEGRALIQLLVALPLKQTSKRAKKMKLNGLRIFFMSYTFGFFVIFTAYNAGLLSLFAIPVIPNPIGIIR